MTTETRELEADLRAVWGEIFPLRDATHKNFSDEILVLGVLMNRKLELALQGIRKLRPGYAEGIQPGVTVKPKQRRKTDE